MHETLVQLAACGPIVTDGAWGTQFQARGLPIGSPPDPWNLTNPDKVLDVAAAYVAAGSRVILTNTFGATPITLERHGYADRAREINREGARLSRAAASGSTLVLASIGPTGKLPTVGEISADELDAAFGLQIEGLVEGGAEGFVIETMSDLAESVVAVRRAAATGLPVVACMTYGSGRNGDRTLMGATPEQASEELLAAGADVVGANCGQGPEGMLAICSRLHAASGRPVWAKPNAGLPKMEGGVAVYDVSPEEFTRHALELVRAGAGFVGGCCGTTPDFIGALRARLAER